MRMTVRKTQHGYPFYEFTGLGAARNRAWKAAETRLPYVHDTWKARTVEARTRDLAIGFLAHYIVESVLKRERIAHISYEDTRIDDYKNDDPFDFLLLPPGYRKRRSLLGWLRDEIYPAVNIQGRFKRPVWEALRAHLQDEGIKSGDLKSSVDNGAHGIEAIIHEQHHIAYATQKNVSGFRVISYQEYLTELGLSSEDYLARKQKIHDVHFRVFFEDAELEVAYYVGFIFGRDMILKGEVGPLPGTPWVLYHRQLIANGYPPGQERDVIFPNQ